MTDCQALEKPQMSAEKPESSGIKCPITGETEDLILLSQSLSTETPYGGPQTYEAHAFHESVTLGEIKQWEQEELQA